VADTWIVDLRHFLTPNGTLAPLSFFFHYGTFCLSRRHVFLPVTIAEQHNSSPALPLRRRRRAPELGRP
jgi:hypothetical protein